MLGTKRYSGFDPRAVGACTLWLDAADSTTLSLSGNTVTQWRDKSGLGCNATPYQSPALTTINGIQAIQFGSNRNFDGSANNVTGTVTVFAVGVQPSGSASWDRLVSLATIGTTTDAFTDGFVVALESPSDANSLAGERNTGSIYSAGTVTADTAFQACSMWTPSNVNIWIHGSNRVNSSYTTKTSGFTYSNYAIGRAIQNGNPGSNPSLTWRGSVGEIMVFNSALSTQQRQTVEGYLARKWGMVSNLISSHPYRQSVPYSRPFNPLDVSGCAMWYDASDPATLTLSGSNVSQWNDKSGNAYHMLQATSSNQPTYDSNTNSIVFAPTPSKFFKATANLVQGTDGQWSCFCVGLRGVSGQIAHFLQYDADPIRVAQFMRVDAGGSVNTIAFNATGGLASVTAGSPSVNTMFLGSARLTSSTSNLTAFLNGTPGTPGTVSSFNTDSNGFVTIGGYAGGTEPLTGRVYEILLYQKNMSFSEFVQIESYLANKWNLRGAMASNHIARIAPALTPQFSPLLVANCSLWLDGLDRSSITLSGSNVTQWNDKSGNARHASQATGSNQPVYDTTLNAVVFSPTPAKFLQGNANFLQGTNGQWSSFAVAMSTNISQSQHFLEYDVTPNRVAQFLRLENDGRLQSISFGGSTAIAYAGKPTNNVPFLGSARTTSSNTTTFLNGTAGTAATQSSPSTSSNATFVVGAYTGGTEPLYGRICEILLYVGGLTLQQHRQIEGYLAWKWGLMASLPSTHPYKSNPVF